MEDNLQENNNVVAEKKNNSKIIIVILTILLVGALGFICYDKFINKEKPPVPAPTTTPEPTDNNKSLTILNKVKLTTENQTITIGNNSFKVRIPSENDGGLYVNDSLVRDHGYGVDTVYVTDNFAFFTLYGQFDSFVEYAIDLNGSEIKIDAENMYIHNIRLENGMIVGNGMNALDSLDENSNATEVELIVKYENNKITVTKK